MFDFRFHLPAAVDAGHKWAIILALVSVNLLCNVVANACFKMSTTAADLRGFLAWQVTGNLAGLATVITLTALLVYLPLHIAYPATIGLAVIGVQIVAASVFFHEQITTGQWMGTLVVVAGILLIGAR